LSKFLLPNEDKFAILAIVNTSLDLPNRWRGRLDDGTRLLTEVPAEIDDPNWEKLIGSYRWTSFKNSNLIFVRGVAGEKPGLDNEHELLAGHLWWLFRCLQLSGVVESDKSYLLKGSLFNGKPRVQQISEPPLFYHTKGYASLPVNLSRLNRAVRHATVRRQTSETGEYGRFLRGLDRLIEGLKHWTGDDRIHDFVRSLEALILPAIGSTKKHFIHRCQTFAKPSQRWTEILDEAYKMRNDVEHLHHWHRALLSHKKADRENVALRRTQQIEGLARFAYSRILSNAEIWKYFRDDEIQSFFWKKPEHRRQAIWGKQIS